MLFHFPTSTIKSILASEISTETTNAIENIALSIREGKHLLTGDRDALNLIIDKFNISDKATSTYKVILSKIATSHSIFNSLSCIIRISPPLTPTTISYKSGLTEFNIPINAFSDSEYTQRGDLLVEDLNDGKLYDTIGKYYLQKHNISWLKFSYRIAPGGGGSITRNYDEYLSTRFKICLCIADGDKSPFCLKNGVIARQLMSKGKSHDSITSYYILPLKSAENLLCSKMVRNILSKNTDTLNICNDYSELETLLPDRIGCFNLKHGYKCSDHKLLHANKRLAAEIYRVLSKSSISKHKLACISSETCNDNLCQDCYILRPFGESLLVDAIAFFEITPIRTISSLLDSRVEALWDEIGKLIVSWFCCTHPIRV